MMPMESALVGAEAQEHKERQMKCNQNCMYFHVIHPVIKTDKYRIRCDWYNKELHNVAQSTRDECEHGRENIAIDISHINRGGQE
jgi:hypothetical protein